MAHVAVPLADDFEDVELTVPMARLEEAGHRITLVGARGGDLVRGKRGDRTVRIDTSARELYPDDFDALLIPGGHSPDKLRMNPHIVSFVAAFCATGRPVAAICHGPQLLIEAEQVRGRTLTSWPSVRKDLENAGATWVDEAVVEDGNLITSRGPDDLPAFCDTLLERLTAVTAGRVRHKRPPVHPNR